MSYTSMDDLFKTTIASNTDSSVEVEFVQLVQEKRRMLGYENTNDGELAAFISYAQAFPSGLLALVRVLINQCCLIPLLLVHQEALVSFHHAL